MVVQFVVHTYSNEKMAIDVCRNKEELPTVTVGDLKQMIAQKLPENQETAVAEMTLISSGVGLKDDCTLLSSFGLGHRSTIQMVKTLNGGLRS